MGDCELSSTALRLALGYTFLSAVLATKPLHGDLQGVSPLRGRKEVQTPQNAVLGFLHLLSTTFPGPSPPTSCCVPGTPARLDLDESRFQSLHGLVSTFMQAASLLGKGSLF